MGLTRDDDDDDDDDESVAIAIMMSYHFPGQQCLQVLFTNVVV